jgi:pimeloyl-ACP methyl ester carboxylesterase
VDSTPDVRRIACPTLVVHGAEDRLIPLAEAQRTAKLVPGARLVTIPAAGHLPNLENRPAFDAAVMQFFAGGR